MVNDPSDIDLSKLGRFWTPVKDKAVSPFGRIDQSETSVIVEIRAERSNVDEFETVATYNVIGSSNESTYSKMFSLTPDMSFNFEITDMSFNFEITFITDVVVLPPI